MTELEMMLQDVAVVEHTVAEHVCEIGQKFVPYTVTTALGCNDIGATLLMAGGRKMNKAVEFTTRDKLSLKMTSQYPKGHSAGT
jgi:hypothetical protein